MELKFISDTISVKGKLSRVLLYHGNSFYIYLLFWSV